MNRRSTKASIAVPLRATLLAAMLVRLASAAEVRAPVDAVLREYCFDCHGDGARKGKVALDEFASTEAMLADHDLWLKVLKNLRAGIMPPPKKAQPTAEQKLEVEKWIKSAVFAIDPQDPDPGRVTLRRLNRVEYRNTIRDLLGVEFEAEKEFPADDAGHGFDNIGDVLTLPPMLLEKYVAAARSVVSKAVPSAPRVPAEEVVPGRRFQCREIKDIQPPTNAASPNTNSVARSERASQNSGRGGGGGNGLVLSYYERGLATHTFQARHAGRYEVLLDFTANEKFVDNQFDYNKCRLVFKVDGRELHSQEYAREGGRAFHFEFAEDWKAGGHEFEVEVQPLTPDQKQVRSLSLRVDSVTVRGPLEPDYWVRPKNFERFFRKDAPENPESRRQYAREILDPFVRRAYRRPVEPETVNRLVALAEATYGQPGKTYESGVSQAMVAVLASPRFLFREEAPVVYSASMKHPLVDEYALASRLSYFLWSSMPDEELFRLAASQSLRKNLPAQTARMLADVRFAGFIRNFTGQWLQTRDIDTIAIDARQVLAREAAADPDQEKRRLRFRELRDKNETSLTTEEKAELEQLRTSLFRRFGAPLRAELNEDLRRAMKQETEKTVEYVIRENRSLLELLKSDYTFLNERLARHYGLTNLNVVGDEMRLVRLAADSPRGGVLTHGSVLTVTSNPTRTSPVKRGLFVLDNLLGTPPPPPPPDIPPLEDAAKQMKERTLSLRETLALHREQPLCSSCHNRMDPLGLALENFNAMGMWREQERSLPIDASGRLLSGEGFTNIVELKNVLATGHAREFYHTLTEKMLTYALGRGLEYYDVETVDKIVRQLEQDGGHALVLLMGIIESAAFQKTRNNHSPDHTKSAAQRADATIKP